MIVFDLRCSPADHVFEAWFGSSADYESQRQRGLVSCPLCGSERIEKAAMAPRVAAKGNQDRQMVGETVEMSPSDAECTKRMLAAMAAAQKKILDQSEYVGGRFADEARAIHVGLAEARPIHGRATPHQVEALTKEGIAVDALPFPVVEPRHEN